MTGRRIAAAAALVAAAGAEIVAAAFSDELRALILCIASVGVALAFGWRAAMRRGKTRAIAVVAVIPSVALLLLALRHDLAGAGVALALVAVAVGAGRAALGRAGAAVAATVVPGKPVPAARHPVLLVNPKAGEGKPEKLGLQDLARERGIETIAVEPGAFEDAGRRAIASGADAIGVAGGDGSQAPVAALAAEHDVAFVCVPAGTLNHFALDLGLDRDDPVGALDAFGEAVERGIDLARVGDRVFCNNVSLGMFAKIVRSKDYRERKLQTVAKMLPALLDEGGAEISLRVTGPEDPEEEPANLVLVSNNPYELRGLGAVGTRERLDTGRLGVVALRVTNAAQIAELGALELAGHVEQFPGWREWSAEEVEVRSDDPVDASIDGEPEELESPRRFSIMPKALRVRVPREHPGVSPAAARRRLGRFTVDRLARLALRGGPEMTDRSGRVESEHR